MERCDGYQGSVWRYGKVRQLRGSVTGVERCDGYQGIVWRYGKVRQLRGSVTVIGEM